LKLRIHKGSDEANSAAAAIGAPIAEGKAKSAGGKSHLERNHTRLCGARQPLVREIAERSKKRANRALPSGNKNVNPGVEVQRPIREAWRRV
jgi:hypothetical protein